MDVYIKDVDNETKCITLVTKTTPVSGSGGEPSKSFWVNDDKRIPINLKIPDKNAHKWLMVGTSKYMFRFYLDGTDVKRDRWKNGELDQSGSVSFKNATEGMQLTLDIGSMGGATLDQD